jgi:hypothetical protein
MATKPAWMTAFNAPQTGNDYGAFYTDPATGMLYHGSYSGGGEGMDHAGDPGSLVGYVGGDGKAWYPGQREQSYDMSGNQTGDWEVEDPNKMGWDEKLILGSILAMAGGAAFSGLGGGAAAGGGGSGGGLNFATGFTDAGTAGGALDAGYAGVAGAGGVPTSVMGSSGSMSAPAGLGAAGSGTGVYGAGAASGGGLLSGLGGGSLLGPAATLIGGLAGSQGQQSENSSTRKTDPRVDPYLFGANGQQGLLGMTYDQLARSQSPERLAQNNQIRSTGMGLLQQPIAGNGFSRFFPGR